MSTETITNSARTRSLPYGTSGLHRTQPRFIATQGTGLPIAVKPVAAAGRDAVTTMPQGVARGIPPRGSRTGTAASFHVRCSSAHRRR